jgi:hypothetical protein
MDANKQNSLHFASYKMHQSKPWPASCFFTPLNALLYRRIIMIFYIKHDRDTIMTSGFKLFSIAIMSIALAGCQNLFQRTGEECNTVGPCNGNTVDVGNNGLINTNTQSQVRRVVKQPPIIVNATGYAAVSTSKRFSKSQARLMALRSSTLDAYRNLSERVYGLKLDGSSSLNNMVLQHDELRSYIDSYLVGAKVVSQREHEDGTFETVVEMALQENFRECVSSPSNIANNPQCQTHQNYKTVNASRSNSTANFYTIE